MASPAQTVYSDRDRMYVVQVILDSDEAENIAYALGLHDRGAQDLLAAAARAREQNGVDDE